MPSTIDFKGYAVTDAKKWDQFTVTSFTPKRMEDHDVEVKIEACGVCSSDVHTITGGWGPWKNDKHPFLIVGHEAVGHVTQVGAKVTEFKVGDRAGVGAQVQSCMSCKPCKTDNENYCPDTVDTYNTEYKNGDIAHGGFSTGIRAHEQFVFKIPSALDTLDVAPMMCGGITVYSPLKRHGCVPGARVGVAGIGGLGHYAVMFAKAMGAEVYAFSHQEDKRADVLKMGADHFIFTGKEGWDKDLQGTLDLIICTIDAAKGVVLTQYLPLLGVNKRMVLCGLPDDELPAFKAFAFAGNGAMIVGSHLGNKKEMYEMLDLAVKKNIKTFKQVIEMKDLGTAVRAVHENKVRFRYVAKVDI